MLCKDPKKRPTSFELARMPCLNTSINRFSEEFDCREFVHLLLEEDEEDQKQKMKNKEEDESVNLLTK